MSGPFLRFVLLPALLVGGIACTAGRTATDIQIAQMDKSKQEFGAYLDHMVDNAILHDMSVADIHFIAHTSELSGVGEARLNRMARLLNTYGGTVRYETLLKDEALIQQRLGHVRDYLSLTGCNMERVRFAAMMSGGRGMPGDEAVIKFRKGTAKETDAGSDTQTLVPSFSPGS